MYGRGAAIRTADAASRCAIFFFSRPFSHLTRRLSYTSSSRRGRNVTHAARTMLSLELRCTLLSSSVFFFSFFTRVGVPFSGSE